MLQDGGGAGGLRQLKEEVSKRRSQNNNKKLFLHVFKHVGILSLGNGSLTTQSLKRQVLRKYLLSGKLFQTPEVLVGWILICALDSPPWKRSHVLALLV